MRDFEQLSLEREARPSGKTITEDGAFNRSADSVADLVKGAEIILVPKGEDMKACINGLAAVCGIEAPPYLDGRDERKSQGITFRYAKGIDIPNWVAEGWADAGATGEDSYVESPRQTELARSERLGEPMCRYSFLVKKEYLTQEALPSFEYRLSNARWDGRRGHTILVPATRPRLLVASKGDLPVWPMDMPIRSSGELAIRLSASGMGADIVKTGKSARKARLVEYQKLADIYPVLLVRNPDENL